MKKIYTMDNEKKYKITELTWEYHKNAERQDFVKILMSGEIDPRLSKQLLVCLTSL